MAADDIAHDDSFFGTCSFAKTSPHLGDISAETKVLHLVLNFENALKLNVAIDECVRKLNSLSREKKEGKRAALDISVHPAKGKIVVTKTKI